MKSQGNYWGPFRLLAAVLGLWTASFAAGWLDVRLGASERGSQGACR